MRQHGDWRQLWNNLNGPDSDTPRAKNILVHIYNDATVKTQLLSNSPAEINQLFQQMRGKGFSDLDALHAIAFVLQEQNWNSKTTGEPFDVKQYVERAKRYVETVIEHPELMRGLRTP